MATISGMSQSSKLAFTVYCLSTMYLVYFLFLQHSVIGQASIMSRAIIKQSIPALPIFQAQQAVNLPISFVAGKQGQQAMKTDEEEESKEDKEEAAATKKAHAILVHSTPTPPIPMFLAQQAINPSITFVAGKHVLLVGHENTLTGTNCVEADRPPAHKGCGARVVQLYIVPDTQYNMIQSMPYSNTRYSLSG